jgi:hypothetical protein
MDSITLAKECIMANNEAKDSGGKVQKTHEGALPPATGKSETAQVPPGSKTGSDTRQSAGGGASTGGPGGPDSGSDAMPGRSNAL